MPISLGALLFSGKNFSFYERHTIRDAAGHCSAGRIEGHAEHPCNDRYGHASRSLGSAGTLQFGLTTEFQFAMIR